MGIPSQTTTVAIILSTTFAIISILTCEILWYHRVLCFKFSREESYHHRDWDLEKARVWIRSSKKYQGDNERIAHTINMSVLVPDYSQIYRPPGRISLRSDQCIWGYTTGGITGPQGYNFGALWQIFLRDFMLRGYRHRSGFTSQLSLN